MSDIDETNATQCLLSGKRTESVWHRTARTALGDVFASNRISSLPSSADVVVIGAGIAGTAMAYWLTRAGVTDVAVIDAAEPGRGATGRNGGMHACLQHCIIAHL